MAFPEDVVKDAWELVESKCECTRALHQHTEGRCSKHLIWENRGTVGWGGWEACPIDGNINHGNLANCEILCFDCRARS
jgi:hypothetical protein